MAEARKQWEGQIVDGIFPLRKYLGGSDHSAVFLTEYAEGEEQKAAIKLVTAERTTADLQLTNWRFAAQLAHPNLLRLFRTGRCRIDGNDLLYLVMEYADEDLADILPERALTPDETRDMLNPVLDALEYLHGKGFVHGDLKPANILASGDQLKLSSDTISRTGETQGERKRTSVYDPPEAISGIREPAGDVWALGTTLVEVLTQHIPDWQPGPNREPVVPATLPPLFAEIARQCLRLEPHRRASVAGIAERLNTRAIAASASASVAVSSLNAVAAAPSPVVQKLPTAITAPPTPRKEQEVKTEAPLARPQTFGGSQTKPRFLVPMIVGAVAFAVILTVPRLFTHRVDGPASPAIASGQPSGKPASAKALASTPPPSKSETAKEAASREKSRSPVSATMQTGKQAEEQSADSLKTASEKQPSAATPDSTAGLPAERVVTPATSKAASARGEVLDQVLPEVPEKARSTIHGRVRVGVRVQVDAAGAVSDAALDSPGPSQFFADLALKAARHWAFSAPEVDGKSVASEWMLRFVFTQTDTKVTPAQTAP